MGLKCETLPFLAFAIRIGRNCTKHEKCQKYVKQVVGPHAKRTGEVDNKNPGKKHQINGERGRKRAKEEASWQRLLGLVRSGTHGSETVAPAMGPSMLCTTNCRH